MIVIYMIKNCVNGKVYIGSTGNITDRFGNHKRTLNKGIHSNEHLQNAWNKYGSDSFEFKTLMVCPDSERNHCEQMFIDLYNSQNREFGYNIRDADFHSVSEETKQKISESLKLSGKMKRENNSQWKDYARITKAGFYKNKQQYKIKFNSKDIKFSLYIFKLLDWFFENYPDEDLEISMEVLDNVLLS